MKQIILICLTLVSLLFNTALAADLSKLVILHTNDTHGYDEKAKGILGMAAVSALKQDYETQGFTVVLLDAGDAIEGNTLANYSEGKAAMEFMNACGYDAMTLGNHEFGYGQDVLLKRIKKANFPVLSANISVKATGQNFVRDAVVITRNSYKLGIFGLTTPETTTSINPKYVQGLTFLTGPQLYACAQAEIDKLRKEGCQVIIALAHLGSSNVVVGNRAEDLINNVKGLDICIDGHDHVVKNRYVKSCLLVETGCHLANIGTLTFRENKWQEKFVPAGSYDKEDTKVQALVAKRSKEVAQYLNKKIGYSEVVLHGERVPGVRTQETNLGDLFADAYLWQARNAKVSKAQIDCALVNGGGIRTSLAVGKITRDDIMTVTPFRNQGCLVTLTGAELLEMLEAATSITPEPLGGFPQVAGIVYTINTKVPFTKGQQYRNSQYYAPLKPGERVTIKSVGNKPFALDKKYTLATSEFIANGGDAYGVLNQQPHNKTLLGYTEEQVLINYIKEGLHGVIGQQYAKPQDRITILQ